MKKHRISCYPNYIWIPPALEPSFESPFISVKNENIDVTHIRDAFISKLESLELANNLKLNAQKYRLNQQTLLLPPSRNITEHLKNDLLKNKVVNVKKYAEYNTHIIDLTRKKKWINLTLPDF